MSPRATTSPAAGRGAITSVALMICTRDRPRELEACLTSVADIDMPDGIPLHVCVADNNSIPLGTEVEALAARHGLSLTHGRAAERGYSSVRNVALDLALATQAELLVFIDDDSTATPGLVREHIAAIERYDADVIVGQIDGIHTAGREGERMSKGGTGNVALRRWIVDPVAGAGLRFDERLNLLGFEDFEFFREAIASGAIIHRSLKPVTRTLLPPHTPGRTAAADPRRLAALITFATMEGRNEIVTTRLRHGTGRAARRVLSRHVPILMQGLSGYVAGLAMALADAEAGRAKREWSRARLARFRGAIGGLFLPGFDRPIAKEGRLVPVPATGLALSPAARAPTTPNTRDRPHGSSEPPPRSTSPS